MARTEPDSTADIETVLSQAEAFTDTYDDYDTDAALRRVKAMAVVRPGDPNGASLPSRYPTVHEQAAHDLDLAASLIVDHPRAHRSLTRLIDHDRIEPEGALVFAALLHLARHREPAEFWFQFAAGAGNATAAHCLALLHQQRAEHRTAAHWRSQAAHAPTRSAAYEPTAQERRALLSERVRRELLRRCWEGRRPSLPPRLEAVIHSLPVEEPDDDFGEIPRPDRSLTRLRDYESSAG
jgi:hypothetical protein